MRATILKWIAYPVLAIVAGILTAGMLVIPRLSPDPRWVPAVTHVTPPQCEGGGDGFCYVDLPDCTEYVTYLDGSVMNWYRQDWCTGESVAD
jgi:hypothetical protein